MPTMTINKKLLEWLHKNAHGYDKAVPYSEIPESLVMQNLKGELMDLHEAGEIGRIGTALFYAMPLVDMTGYETKKAVQAKSKDIEDITPVLASYVYEHLTRYCQGRAHAIKLEELGKACGLSWRSAAKVIEYLRHQGRPVCTSRGFPAGAYIAITVQEQEECLRTIYAAAYKTLSSARALEKALDKDVVKKINEEFDTTKLGQFEFKAMERGV
jgi:hypothetical protein